MKGRGLDCKEDAGDQDAPLGEKRRVQDGSLEQEILVDVENILIELNLRCCVNVQMIDSK